MYEKIWYVDLVGLPHVLFLEDICPPFLMQNNLSSEDVKVGLRQISSSWTFWTCENMSNRAFSVRPVNVGLSPYQQALETFFWFWLFIFLEKHENFGKF